MAKISLICNSKDYTYDHRHILVKILEFGVAANISGKIAVKLISTTVFCKKNNNK